MTAELGEVDDDRHWASRHWPGYFALLLTAAGLVLVILGYLTPAYTDPVAAERIRSGLECERGIANNDVSLRCEIETWRRSMEALRTNKWSLVDAGGGLLASAVTMLGFLWWRGKKSWSRLLTTRSSLSILALAGLGWLVQIPAFVLLLFTEASRGYYPHWADTLVIPITDIQSAVLTLLVPYMAIWLVFVVGARLPAPVFRNIPGRPLVNILWTGTAAVLLVPTVLYLLVAILNGPVAMVPFLWLTMWLALCARAAALTRHRPRSTQQT
jgi:hypothetical protein